LGGVSLLCSDPDAMVRLSAAVATEKMGLDSCRGVFGQLLGAEDFGVRSATARVLGEVDIAPRADLLARALKDQNIRVRTAAVRAAGMMGGSRALPLLLAMLEDPKEVIRAYAAGNLIALLR
jgi:HEAT repeat protein